MTVVLCTSPASSQDPSDSEREPRVTYYVQGVTKAGPVKSEQYSSKERAFQELETWKKEHGPGGLLESDPFVEGPEVMREYKGKPEPLKPEPIDPKKPQSRPGATTPADGKPLDLFKGVNDKMAAERKGAPPGAAPPSIAGKKATGVIGKYKITMEFWGTGNKGDVVITGEANGKGKWTQDGSALTMETETKTYRAKIEKDSIKGFQFQRNADTGAVDWTVRLQVTPQRTIDLPSELPKSPAKVFIEFRKKNPRETGWHPWQKLEGAIGSFRPSATTFSSAADAEKIIEAAQTFLKNNKSPNQYIFEFRVVAEKPQ